jgi:hypothetical protein
MGFNKRYLPDSSELDKKLKNEGSKYFYEMYFKKVDCWFSENPDSISWIKKFEKKYYGNSNEFNEI